MPVSPALIDWSARETKRRIDSEVRAVMAERITKLKTCDVLSFPADLWKWETDTATAFSPVKFSFQGLERDPLVHLMAKSNIAGLQTAYKSSDFKLSDSSFREHLINSTDDYDIVYADYMGTWSKEKLRDMEVCFELKRLRRHGFLVFTIALSRGQKATLETLKEYALGYYDIGIDFLDHRPANTRKDKRVAESFKLHGIPAQVKEMAAEFEQELQPLAIRVYPSGDHNCPEACFIFQRTK